MSSGPVFDIEVTQARPPFSLRAHLHSTSRVVAVQGPSGAGKSSLLRILAGVDRDAVGRVAISSVLWQDDGPDSESAAGGARRRFVPPWERGVGWAPQGALLFPHLDVERNLAYGGANGARVSEMAGMLEISGLLGRSPSGLSGGERQRVSLGRALLSARTLLLLDEPFSALDPDLRQELAERVGRWTTEAGLPVVIVTHDEDDLRGLAGERWRLVGGEITAVKAGPTP
jgi:molybdate transport system ATP-binding protein